MNQRSINRKQFNQQSMFNCNSMEFVQNFANESKASQPNILACCPNAFQNKSQTREEMFQKNILNHHHHDDAGKTLTLKGSKINFGFFSSSLSLQQQRFLRITPAHPSEKDIPVPNCHMLQMQDVTSYKEGMLQTNPIFLQFEM